MYNEINQVSPVQRFLRTDTRYELHQVYKKMEVKHASYTTNFREVRLLWFLEKDEKDRRFFATGPRTRPRTPLGLRAAERKPQECKLKIETSDAVVITLNITLQIQNYTCHVQRQTSGEYESKSCLGEAATSEALGFTRNSLDIGTLYFRKYTMKDVLYTNVILCATN